MIPFLELNSGYFELKEDIDLAVSRVFNNGQYILGDEVHAFEEEWANFCGADFCSSVGNGLDALVLSLNALGVGPGDEVILPAHTFIATWLAVSRVGAKIVPIDVSNDGYNIDHSKIRESINSRTKAIICVHLYGEPCNLIEINKVAKENNLYVIEDAAQAHGAKYNGKRIGAHSDVVCWSFYPAKNLGAFGDGGAITTNKKDIYENIKMLRNYGSNEKYVNEIKGFNTRLDPIQASILRVKLKFLEEWNFRREKIAQIYLEGLGDIQLFDMPLTNKNNTNAWHLFVIKTPIREKVIRFLEESDIGYSIHYPIPPHKQIAYKDDDFSSYDLSNTEILAKSIISLPIGPHLSIDNAYKVVEKLNLNFANS